MQTKGVPRERWGNLLDKCLSITKKQGFKTVHGIVLQENKNMLALGKKLGFEAKRDLDDGDNRLAIHFGGGVLRNQHRKTPQKQLVKKVKCSMDGKADLPKSGRRHGMR